MRTNLPWGLWKNFPEKLGGRWDFCILNFLKFQWGRFSSLIALLTVLLLTAGAATVSAESLAKIRERGVLLWGADAEGGGPYVFPDPERPDRLVGFEVDLAQAIAKELGVTARHCQNAWESLIPALIRGDFDLLINGLEITPQRMGLVRFSKPYYVFTEQLVVRKEENGLKTLKDLKGKKVGTLSGALAHTILSNAEGVDLRVYSGQADP